jgi:hypothetical protein
MPNRMAGLVLAMALAAGAATADEGEHHHDHPIPEHLGAVHFQTSCDARVQARFDRADALLHSFAYSAAHHAFAEVAAADPHCAMALWGEAMTHYHQLWEPNVDSPAEMAAAEQEIGEAAHMGGGTPRERAFIAALGRYYQDAAATPPLARAQRYSDAMAGVAKAWPADDEAQVYYALSLVAIGTATPSDHIHANQKRAAAILQPLWRKQPNHPGAAHYLIHAYDSAELAPQGLAAARAYSKIAPSAPHALHMPSHIYTRLGLWRDSVASNLAARAAATAQGDIGEELHAMDYLTYADLQLGRVQAARQVAADSAAMAGLPAAAFKIGYAANAMPVRVAVESGDWAGAARLEPRPGSTPKTAALAWWARAIGRSRGTPAADPAADIAQLTTCRDALRTAGDAYGAAQADALLKSAEAWDLDRRGDAAGALARLAAAADEEDSLEKLPATPGPIVPAREQLGELLLAHHRPVEALATFKVALTNAPHRRAALKGAIAAAEASRKPTEAEGFRRQLAEFDTTR